MTVSNLIRETLRGHQKATDCSDERMIQILCDFIEWLDDKGCEFEYPTELYDFVVDKLDERPLPREVP